MSAADCWAENAGIRSQPSQNRKEKEAKKNCGPREMGQLARPTALPSEYAPSDTVRSRRCCLRQTDFLAQGCVVGRRREAGGARIARSAGRGGGKRRAKVRRKNLPSYLHGITRRIMNENKKYVPRRLP